MKSRNNAIIGTAVLLAFAVWVMTRTEDTPQAPAKPPEAASSVPAAAPATTPVPNETAAPPAGDPAPRARVPKPGSETARTAIALNTAEPLAAASAPPDMPPPRRVSDAFPEAAPDFDKIFIMFRNYRTLTGENPVGTNREIMEAIIGGNPKGAKLGPPEGQQLNSDGELTDRWGTPYFFHQLNKDRMEIRSAGPDRILWNADDLIGD